MLAPRWMTLSFSLFSAASAINTRSNSSVDQLNMTAAAVDAMMMLYDDKTGLWEPNSKLTSWWQSGVALWALAEYMLKTGSREYLDQAKNTVKVQRAPLSWWPEGGGDFRADSTDDTGWWALAMISMYELTGDDMYLDIAKEDEAYMWKYWNTTTCGGGLIWNIPSLSYHNAISNELYLELAAKLHNLVDGDTEYLNRALKEWQWFTDSGMVNPQGLVNDGLTEDITCMNNGDTTWTYNQGVVLGGLVELFKATGEKSYLNSARSIADAAVNSTLLIQDGIITEPCSSETQCEPNGTNFKGIFVRELAKLNAALDDHPYTDLIKTNAEEAYANARNDSDFYGFLWMGPFDVVTIGTQEAAVHLLTAAYL
ncbi:glycoside hydrolase family 76 protein [Annulohypoxylon maeteangense]|uniref:glycoside hydrolase family 76 protein n=1 Tax=Annulohypoxylon maeteangense TaxID=1927788 RepID=UPI0020086FA9|nr:glycoside hydrolase family 76 protein [Annulohypoxylon maeteangense]KAI0887054.1 glycoside hydrolase family 76 protein [Annulohypoxylon maeteangense]